MTASMTKIVRLIKAAVPHFAAKQQFLRWSGEEFNGGIRLSVSIEKEVGKFVRFRSFDIRNSVLNLARYQPSNPWILFHKSLKPLALFQHFSIDRNFGLYSSDVQLLSEWVYANRSGQVLFRSCRNLGSGCIDFPVEV